ncbi:MAG: hypothetical protein ACOC32_02570 [Nanoarchaeota archaeon]
MREALIILFALLVIPGALAATCDGPGQLYMSPADYGNQEDTDRSTEDTIETTGCCGDYFGYEYPIRMDDFAIVEPGQNGSRVFSRYSMNYACCPSSTDCVYKGRCYALGEIIAENPRYACGSSNRLIEALDYDHATEDEFDQQSVDNSENAYTVQEVPIVNPEIISCNSANPAMPQVWLPEELCRQGTMRFKVIDGPSGNLLKDKIDVQLELFKLGGRATTEYTNFTYNMSKKGVFTLEGLLGSYYNVLVFVAGGNIGSLSTVRVNFDEDDPEVHTIKTYRDNTCHGCVDYSLGNGLCNMDCQGRGYGSICDYGSQAVMEACHLHAPGNEVVINGTRVECCNTIIGPKLPEVKSYVECTMGNLVKKEYAMEWKGEPIKLVVSVCGDE